MSRAPRLAGAVGWPFEFAERYRALGLWHGQSIGDWFEQRAAEYATREAVVDGERRVSYEQLASRVRQRAASFVARGIRPLERVVVQLPNGLPLIEVLLGLIRCGAIPVLALPAHRKLELQAFCERSAATGLVVAARDGRTDLMPMLHEVRAQCPGVRCAWLYEGPEASGFEALVGVEDAAAQRNLKGAQVDAGEVALLQLSGGSTGIPKLIARTHDDYLYSVRASAALCELGPQTRLLAALPMTHNFTLSSPGVLGVFDVGGCVITCAQPIPDLVLPLLVREQVSLLAAVPSLVRVWVEAKARLLGDQSLPGLTLQVGGAKLDEGLARAALQTFGCRLQQVFGMAEGLVNYTRLNAPLGTVLSTQGKPLSRYDEVRIVNPESPEGPAVTAGEVGELQTRGPYTIRGYYNDSAPESRFTQDGFYRTGDLVRQTADGDLVVEGRLGERILRAGEKFSPVEVEEHLLAFSSVSDAAVVGVSDVHLGQRSHAFVVIAAGEALVGAAALRTFLRQRGLAEFKLPDRVHVVAELPRTKVGKTDKAALRELAQRA